MHAYFTPNNYTLYFNKNTGNDPSPASKTVTFDAAYGALASITKKGHSLVGWFTASTGGTQVTESTTVKTAGDHTVYAQWTPNTYYVTMSVTNGTAGSSQVAIVYPGSNTVTIKPNAGAHNAAGYYLSSITCTNGYTVTGYTTGRSATGQQTITINNNNNDKNSTCTVTYTTLNYNASAYCEYGRTLDGSGNCTYYYQNNEGKCGCQTAKSCEHQDFGVKEYNSCPNASKCGGYTECEAAGCGYKECTNATVCGYKKCENDACPCAETGYETKTFSDSNAARQLCDEKGVGDIGIGGGGSSWSCTYPVCKKHQECKTSGCGAATCTAAGCGYKSCEDSSCPAKSCPNDSCTVKEYNTREDYNRCGGCATANSCNKTENEYRKYSCPNGGQLNGTTCEF